MNKKIVVLGSSGMAGHMVYKYLSSLGKYDVLGVSKQKIAGIKSVEFDVENDMPEFVEFLWDHRPDVIINCIGLLVKACEDDHSSAIFLNSYLPHLLAATADGIKARVVHISTDCVFDGSEGPYFETSWPTEKNWYGRTKALGEINNGRDITLRTSIIGPELKLESIGLFEWFMRQTGTITGYNNVIWNGITTLELAIQIDRILDTDLSGIYHLTSQHHITKGNLLNGIRNIWERRDTKILLKPADEPKNKALINSRGDEYNPGIPSYLTQLEELKAFCSGMK
jgi:dTDP-4-dehydrorhamnose reductase